MQNYSLVHVTDAVLLRDLAALVAQDRLTTAMLLAHIAEVDARRLFVPAGYPSMHAYCVDELRLSEDSAKKRIQAARAARRFPALFRELAEGRLHLAGVYLLAPHLAPENAEELIQAAIHRRRIEIEEMLARRFPPLEMPGRVRAVTPLISNPQKHAQPTTEAELKASIEMPNEGAPGHLQDSREEVAPPSPEQFLLQLTITESIHEKLRYAQTLLSHAVPTGDVAQVLDRALDALIPQLEKRKFGAMSRRSSRSRFLRRSSAGRRYVPADVRRAVWGRDQGQCTFVSASGTRCKARRLLEFDHMDPVARGGQATVDRMRLRCRAHNQYEAERAFGTEFMNRKRSEARADRRVRIPALTTGETGQPAIEQQSHNEQSHNEQSQEVLAGLRGLGCRADEARRALELSETLFGATLEERMRVALKSLRRGFP
jgi:hypothetical protein